MFIIDKYSKYFKYLDHYASVINILNDIFKYSNQKVIVTNLTNQDTIILDLLNYLYKNPRQNIITYSITTLTNIKKDINVEQSIYYIIIKPNDNSTNLIMLQKVITDFIEDQNINTMYDSRLIKTIIIMNLDEFTLSTQIYLKQLIDKYINICNFLLLSNNIVNIHFDIVACCNVIKVPKISRFDIGQMLSYISIEENIDICYDDISEIIDNNYTTIYPQNLSHLNICIWMLSFYQNNIIINTNYDTIINKIVSLVVNINCDAINTIVIKIRKNFYILFVSNIKIEIIMSRLLIRFINMFDDLEMKYKISNIISTYSRRINKGTRQIIHFEACMIQLMNLIKNDTQ